MRPELTAERVIQWLPALAGRLREVIHRFATATACRLTASQMLRRVSPKRFARRRKPDGKRGRCESSSKRQARPAPTCWRAAFATGASSRMRSIRRSGSAAPHSSWSPTVNAREVLAAHRQLAQPADRHVQRARDRGRRELRERRGLVVRDHAHPLVAAGDQRLDLVQRDVAPQLDRQRLAVTAHRADADADARRPGRSLRAEAPESCWLPPWPSTPRGSVRCPCPCRSRAGGCRRADSRTARWGRPANAGCPTRRDRCRGWPTPGRPGAPRRSRGCGPSARPARACAARRRRTPTDRSSPSPTRPDRRETGRRWP